MLTSVWLLLPRKDWLFQSFVTATNSPLQISKRYLLLFSFFLTSPLPPNFFILNAQTIAALGTKARNDQITIEEMTGGTFTISNGGVYGSMMGTPIVNPPQSAILGMHGTAFFTPHQTPHPLTTYFLAITDRATVINGELKVRPIMYLALTYDHRLIDGKEAVTFLRKIKHCVEDPRRLLLDL